MTKKDKSKNKKKLNSQKHKKQIIKDLNKKKELHQKQQKERYAVQNGSKVITHNKTDLRNAPTYKAEKVKKGGFQPTFPAPGGNEGFFDTRQKANEILSLEMQKLNWQNVMLNEVQKRNMNPEQMQEYAEKNKELFDIQAQYDYTKKLVNVKNEIMNLEEKFNDLARQNELEPEKIRADSDAHEMYNSFEKDAKSSRDNVKRLKEMIAMKEEMKDNKKIMKKYMNVLKLKNPNFIASVDHNLRMKTEEIRDRLSTLERLYGENNELEKKKRMLIECNIEMNARQDRLVKDLLGLDVHGMPVNEKDFENPEIAAKLAQLKAGEAGEGTLAEIESKIALNHDMIKEMITGSIEKIKEHEKGLKPLVQEYNKIMAEGKKIQPAMIDWLRKTELVDEREIEALSNPGPQQFLKTAKKFREVLDISHKFNKDAFDYGYALLKNAHEIYMQRPYLRALINIGGNQISRIKLFTNTIEEFRKMEGNLRGFSPGFFDRGIEEGIKAERKALTNGEEVMLFNGPIVDFPYPLNRKVVPVRSPMDLCNSTDMFDFEDSESTAFMRQFFTQYGLLDSEIDYANMWNQFDLQTLEKFRDKEDEAIDQYRKDIREQIYAAEED